MPFHFTCPYCYKKTLIDESLAGEKGLCANCAKTITIPEPPARPPSSAKPVNSEYTASGVKPTPKVLSWIARLVGLFLVIGVGGALAVYLLGPTFRGLKSRRDRATCMTNLQRIAAALNEYADEYGSYPPPTTFDAAGKPLYSWRVLILPQLGESGLYARFKLDEPWDSNNNSMLIADCPTVYISPSAATTRFSSESNYMLITGKGTLFPPSGPMHPSQIKDAKSATILVVETQNTANEWCKPSDIVRSKMNSRIGSMTAGQAAANPTSIGGNHVGGATVVFADGSAGWLPDDLAPTLLDAMISHDGGEPVDTTPYQP